MKNIQGIQLIMESNEELLPDFFMDFPYICSCVEFDKYIDPVVPWHWHHAVELFYIKSGRVEYTTPNGKWIFPAGTGGFVNSNVLHSSRVSSTKDGTVQLLHLFDSELLTGGISNRIEERYIRPLTDRSGLEMICLSPEDPGQAALLQKIQAGFELEEGSWGYEITLRQLLTEVWLGLLELACAETEDIHKNKDTAEKMKAMMDDFGIPYNQDSYVFCNYSGNPYDPRVYEDLFKRTLKAANLERINFHALRHTFATRALEAGMDIKVLSSILGHAQASTTLNLYAHALADHRKLSMDKMSEYYSDI